MIDYVLPSLLNLIDPFNICLMLLGLTGGIITGALPGLSATMGVALMVPVTFAMNPTSGLIMLGAIYVGAIYGGANSAILICTPGTPSSVATTFDGWPLTQRGEADVGLYTSLISSGIGGFIGVIFLSCNGDHCCSCTLYGYFSASRNCHYIFIITAVRKLCPG